MGKVFFREKGVEERGEEIWGGQQSLKKVKG